MVYWFKQSSIAGSVFCQWLGVSPFRGLLELRAPSQAYTLGSTKYQSPGLQFPSVPFYLLFIFCSGEGELQAEITASFLETWCPFFPGRQCCWQAAGVEPRRCLFHWPIQSTPHLPHPCVAQMSHICSASSTCSWCLSLITCVQIYCTTHGLQSTYRNPEQESSLPRWVERKIEPYFYLSPESWLRCVISLSLSHLLLISATIYKARRTSQWTYLQFKVGMKAKCKL